VHAVTVRIIQGDVREKLAELPADFFDCVVMSPPYYGLRDYGTATWEGGDTTCEHSSVRASDGGKLEGGLPASSRDRVGADCRLCGARRIDAQIGLEPTLDAYLETMVAVCRELRRVLKPTGVFFLNVGDSYAGSWGAQSRSRTEKSYSSPLSETQIKSAPKATHTGTIRDAWLKPKDLFLVPERLGIMLQADGWWVRSRIIWHKKNPMPESVTDRPTSAHETIWMLTKSERYFWDAEAVKEGASTFGRQNTNGPSSKRRALVELRGDKGNLDSDPYSHETRSLRNVWTFASHPFPGAHFATMPPEIAERCIKAGSSERGCCVACGAPLVRVVDRGSAHPFVAPSKLDRFGNGDAGVHRNIGSVYQKWLDENPKQTIGWRPSCKCPAADPAPSRILDPFAGAGTTGLVADRLGRDATLIDLNTQYAGMALNRIVEDAPLFVEVAAE
jgi:DNA modification methylase